MPTLKIISGIHYLQVSTYVNLTPKKEMTMDMLAEVINKLGVVNNQFTYDNEKIRNPLTSQAFAVSLVLHQGALKVLLHCTEHPSPLVLNRIDDNDVARCSEEFDVSSYGDPITTVNGVFAELLLKSRIHGRSDYQLLDVRAVNEPVKFIRLGEVSKEICRLGGYWKDGLFIKAAYMANLRPLSADEANQRRVRPPKYFNVCEAVPPKEGNLLVIREKDFGIDFVKLKEGKLVFVKALCGYLSGHQELISFLEHLVHEGWVFWELVGFTDEAQEKHKQTKRQIEDDVSQILGEYLKIMEEKGADVKIIRELIDSLEKISPPRTL